MNNRGLHVNCSGVGTPTVVLESGLGEGSGAWGLIQPLVTRFTRVCSYDRAGLGETAAGPVPRTSRTIVTQLRALLASEGIGPPYVLVGHSIGGLHALLFAREHPGEVVGMVLVDASHPDATARRLAALPPERPGEGPSLRRFREYLRQGSTAADQNIEGLDRAGSEEQVRGLATLGDLPLVVLSHGRGGGYPPDFPRDIAERVGEAWHRMQAELAGLSSNSLHVIARDSGHHIHQDAPGLVAEAIRQVVDAARGQDRRLPACRGTFERLGGLCGSRRTLGPGQA